MGVTDAFDTTSGNWKYWSSGEDYDESGAAWPNRDMDGVNTGDPDEQYDCAVVQDGSIDDVHCDASFYALCVLPSSAC